MFVFNSKQTLNFENTLGKTIPTLLDDLFPNGEGFMFLKNNVLPNDDENLERDLGMRIGMKRWWKKRKHLKHALTVY